MPGVALYKLVLRFEAGVGDFSHAELLVVSFLSAYDWSVSGQWEMDARVRHQVGLELCLLNNTKSVILVVFI